MANTYVDVVTKRVDVNGTSFVYRETGEKNGIPIVLLHHLTAVLDDWDPRTIDSLAQKHRVIAFNNRGVGGSKGTTPDTIDDMATDAVAFIRALGLSKTDLLGFSLGGFIAQVTAQKHPDLVRRMILAGTSAAGGEGISNVASVLQNAVARATAEKKHPKQSLFFTQSQDGQKAAAEFLQRLGTRQQDRDLPATQETIVAQGTAITKSGMAPKPTSLGGIQHPVLVANGDTDVMVPSINSVELARKLPHSELSIFLMLDMELSSSTTARFSSRLCDFCRANLDAALSVHRQTSTGHQIATRGHDLEYRGTEEVLVVESPHPDDAIVPVEI